MNIGDRPVWPPETRSGAAPEGLLPSRVTAPGRGVGTLLALAAVLLALTSVSLLRSIDRAYPRQKVEKLLYLPDGTFVKTAVLGFDEVAADYLWLRTIGYFGGHYMSDKRYPWLAHHLNLVTDLDPRFSIAYYFGGIVLALEAGRVDESTSLLEKGMRNLPDNWKYPFFAGFNYFYYKGDLWAAADYLRRASALPGSPEYLPQLVASLYARSGQVDEAVNFLQALAATVDDWRLRENILRKIDDLRAGRLPEGLERILREKR